MTTRHRVSWRFRWLSLTVGAVVLVTAVQTITPVASAPDVQDIQWETLLPAKATELRQQMQALQIELRKLPREQQRALPKIVLELSVKDRLAAVGGDIEQISPIQRRMLEENLSDRYPDVVRLWREMSALRVQLDELGTTTNAPLNGSRVRLSGYLLPLDLSDGEITEFLLVPFVGACIHVPPPPPNQIVHVSVEDAFTSDSLYAPVTVTGLLASGAGQVDLFLVDGTASVDLGYSMAAEAVVPVEVE